MKDPISRRSLLKSAGLAGAVAVLPGQAPAQPASQATRPLSDLQPRAEAAPQTATPVPIYFFFTEPEAAFVRAAADRLIPPDDQWPGAADAGVVDYIDRQLAGAYGSGANIYLEGPWREGTPEQGYQLRFTPAELYRISIAAIDRYIGEQFGDKSFPELGPDIQDQVLRGIETGEIDLGEAPGLVFFETLLANTIEGFFSDPAYGGNRDMVGWRMIGFPGAFAQFAYLVDDHGMTYDRPPMSMAQLAAHPHRH